MKRAAPYALFGAITIACFWKFIFLGWTLYDVGTLQRHLGTAPEEPPGWFASHRPAVDRGDTILVLPMLHRVYNEGLHHGELRLWNPHLFCGYPVYYDTLLHPFYPPNLIFHAVLPPRIAYDLLLLLHFFFSGAAVYWLLRGMGRSEAAATLAGVIWMLLGYNSLWFSAQMFLGAGVFAPLALLGIHRGLERRELRPFALGGLAMGLVILGSHGQHALHLLIFFSIWLLVCALRDRASLQFIVKGGGIFLVTALGLGMPAILTRMEALTNGVRIPGDDLPLHYGDPWRLPTYLSGLAIGKVCIPPGGLLRSEFTIYAGVLATALAVAGAVRNFRDPWIRFLSIFAVVALLVVFLKPLAELALLIPVLNNSMPARWVYVAGFCLTLLAASGLDALRADPVKTTRILIIPAGISLLLFCFYLNHGAVAETFIGFVLAAGAVFTAARPRWCLALCLSAILVDLLPDFVLWNRHADPKPLEISRSSLGLPDEAATPWRATGVVRLENGSPSLNVWTRSIANNFLALAGAEGVMGYESIAPLPAVQFCVAVSGADGVAGSGRVLAVDHLESSLLHLANMRFVLWPYSIDLEPRFRKIWSHGPLTLYENPAVMPRAYLVSRAVRAADENGVVQTLRSSGFPQRTSVVIHDAAELPRTGEGGGTVTWTSHTTDRVELKVDAASDAILVLSDTYDPGWEARVDGKETPILKANLAFRAVAVPAGVHQVVFRFRPSSARHGLIVSLLALAAVVALCVRRKKSVS